MGGAGLWVQDSGTAPPACPKRLRSPKRARALLATSVERRGVAAVAHTSDGSPACARTAPEFFAIEDMAVNAGESGSGRS